MEDVVNLAAEMKDVRIGGRPVSTLPPLVPPPPSVHVQPPAGRHDRQPEQLWVGPYQPPAGHRQQQPGQPSRSPAEQRPPAGYQFQLPAGQPQVTAYRATGHVQTPAGQLLAQYSQPQLSAGQPQPSAGQPQPSARQPQSSARQHQPSAGQSQMPAGQPLDSLAQYQVSAGQLQPLASPFSHAQQSASQPPAFQQPASFGPQQPASFSPQQSASFSPQQRSSAGQPLQPVWAQSSARQFLTPVSQLQPASVGRTAPTQQWPGQQQARPQIRPQTQQPAQQLAQQSAQQLRDWPQPLRSPEPPLSPVGTGGYPDSRTRLSVILYCLLRCSFGSFAYYLSVKLPIDMQLRPHGYFRSIRLLCSFQYRSFFQVFYSVFCR